MILSNFMENCFRCGISGNKSRLLDAISEEEIVKICEECAEISDLPIVSNYSYGKSNSEKKPSVYERLKKISENNPILSKQETTLSGIVDKKIREKYENENKPKIELIDNFHWIIFRARRGSKLTQKQLAEVISEPESSIKMIEQGRFPTDSYRLITKLEQYFNIRIKKDDIKIIETRIIQKEHIKEYKSLPEELDFKSRKLEELNISDLKEIKRRKEEDLEKRKKEETERLNTEKLTKEFEQIEKTDKTEEILD